MADLKAGGKGGALPQVAGQSWQADGASATRGGDDEAAIGGSCANNLLVGMHAATWI